MTFSSPVRFLCAATFFCSGMAQAQKLTPFHNAAPFETAPQMQPEELVLSSAPELPVNRNFRSSRPVAGARTIPFPKVPNTFGQTPVHVYPYLESVAATYPSQAKLRIYGKSVQGRSLVALEIAPLGVPKAKLRRLVVICRQHGNEPEATASGAIFIKQFLKPTNDLQRRIARKTTLLIVPIANPDGAAQYQRRTAQNIDMNRDWTKRQSPEVRALTQLVANWKPHFLVDNHQWLPSPRQPIPMAEASGGAKAKTAARVMSQKSAHRGYYLAARNSRPSASQTLCHRFWGKQGKVPSILLETRHNPGVYGARERAINQAVAALWGAAESMGH